MSEFENETFLGDGLYASFDGYQFRLRAPRDREQHIVFLEPAVLYQFEEFVKRVRAKTESIT